MQHPLSCPTSSVKQGKKKENKLSTKIIHYAFQMHHNKYNKLNHSKARIDVQ